LPAWDLLPDIKKYYRVPSQSSNKIPVMPLITSRGCPYKCIFCDRKVFGNKIRIHGAEYVLKMMGVLREQFGIKEFHIEDDIFTVQKDRLDYICRELILKKYKSSWSCFSRVDSPLDLDILKLMKKAGCWQIKFGIESGSQSVLNNSKKGISVSQIRTAVLNSKKAGLKIKGFFILGLPGENSETLKETINLMTDLPFDDISFSFFAPYPGTEVYSEKKKYEEYGSFIGNHWRELNSFNPIFIPKELNKELLKEYHKKIIRIFFFRPRIIFSYITRLNNPRQIFLIFKGFIALLIYFFRKK